MQRTLSISLALSMLLLPACKRDKDKGAEAPKRVEPLDLVPDAAEFVVGLSPQKIGDSQLYSKYSAQLQSTADFQDFVGAFNDCGLDPFAFESVVVGATQTRDFVVTVAGEGVGKQDAAVCVIDNMLEETGQQPASKVEQKQGKSIIEFTDGRAYLVNDNLLAIASTSWAGTVAELIDGKGTAAVAGSKKAPLAKADTKKALWWVALMPSQYTQDLAAFAPEAKEVETFVGSVDLSEGVAVELIAGFEAEAKAEAAAERAKTALAEGKNQLAAFGVPEQVTNILDSVKIETSGSDVNISGSASMADLEFVDSLLP